MLHNLLTRHAALLMVATFATLCHAQQASDLKALDGEWIYVDDITEGRALEQFTSPISSKFAMRSEEGAVILVYGHGSGHRDVRVALDGSVTEKEGSPGTIVRYSGSWKEGVFSYQLEFLRGPERKPDGVYKREFQATPNGLIVRAHDSVGLYRHFDDIALPTPAKATIGDLAWISGAWVGTRGTNGAISFEERWSPAKGGAMLAISRTVNKEKMSAFEFLRIVERDGGLVYIAQPGGAAPTEFVLTELTGKRAVFDNPRHDYPKRIVYELSSDGGLTATIGLMKGGTPRRFVFKPEGG